ncbi:L-aspartate oxidase [Spirulina sp. CS-785/01]|uniref:L-aspartate oxidase n=1 Tax=Spirulina sp. CS-785/01 TaxID=3021716 RepID=UPI00232D1184|nr:L-aspartate oxidase [Spirulina sp. CS-785/01]MDB9311548.1 L-aspartate oxidase [Spirulina sp. CS-785/01]
MTVSSSAATLSSPLPSVTDVVVVGAGAAGLYATLCLPAEYSVCLLSKESMQTGASDWAQGGIAAAIAPDDSSVSHLQDTLKAGAGLCDRTAVEFLVNNAVTAINRLVDLGVAFDRKNNDLALTLEAAHSHPRVLHAADTTGRAIVSTLIAKVQQCPNVTIAAQAFALSLWVNPKTQRCEGLWVWHQGQIHFVRAAAVILATGGGGQVFAQTTNPAVSTGDGIALAWRAGAQLRDLEFFQFHPTALMKANAPHFLISEAVRGEGAHLIDAQGRRFAFDYHPKGELAPRDVVSRAIFHHLEKHPDQDCVYLDLSPIPPERVRYRFPNIIQKCQKWGIDVFTEPIPVAPAAHYWMGGIATDTDTQTTVSGLYAVGEVASTGVHGANRLASNSLLECLVYAGRLAELSLSPLGEVEESGPVVTVPPPDMSLAELLTLREELQQLMWHSAGIARTEGVLKDAIAQVQQGRTRLAQSSLYAPLFTHPSPATQHQDFTKLAEHIRIFTETVNLFDVAYLILQSALFRQESRGGHYRSDYPQPSDVWQGHTLLQGEKCEFNES